MRGGKQNQSRNLFQYLRTSRILDAVTGFLFCSTGYTSHTDKTDTPNQKHLYRLLRYAENYAIISSNFSNKMKALLAGMYSK